jgi:hypothetical protein
VIPFQLLLVVFGLRGVLHCVLHSVAMLGMADIADHPWLQNRLWGSGRVPTHSGFQAA